MLNLNVNIWDPDKKILGWGVWCLSADISADTAQQHTFLLLFKINLELRVELSYLKPTEMKIWYQIKSLVIKIWLPMAMMVKLLLLH